MPVDYSNTLIYKIVCNDSLVADFYLGYTTLGYRVLCDRFKQRCKKSKWFVCEFIRNHGGFQNWNIERLAVMSLSSSIQARIELRKHFDTGTPSLNVQTPMRSPSEYHKTEKSKLAQQKYRGENKEKIQELQRNIYIRNKESIKIQRRLNYIANRDKLIQRSRDFREKKKLESIQE